MADSGIKCSEEVQDEFQKLSKNKQYRYIIFRISDDETPKVIVEKTGDPSKTFDDFKSDLPKDQCRYAVFDLEFDTKEKQKRKKVIFLSHSPDASPDRQQKMMYSSTKKEILKKLGTVNGNFHYGDYSDIDLDDIVQEMRTKSR